ncbi:MAG: nucleotidyltransferase domain-containing protein [Sedimentisphaerales bacterium]|nr:nucleotidyltransferase domain-containing protein [Sedimentisphaerales bacterium]
MSEMASIVSEMTRRIRSVSDPEKIILFGSRARGTAHAGSDFDILIIQDSDQPRYRRAVALYRILADLPVEVELVVYTPEEVNQWSRVPEAFVTTALREGKVIYEKPD